MRQLKRIIVGYDLTADGEDVLQSAAILARRSGAALKLVHVVEPYSLYQRLSHPFTEPYSQEELAQKAGHQLEACANSLMSRETQKEALSVEYEVRTGKPFVELILARRAWDGDLIVVGGTRQGEGILLGSTADRVVRKAMVPVLVAKRRLAETIRTILVPTDFSSCAKKAAEEALVLAERFGSRVHFFHALEPLPAYALGADPVAAALPPVALVRPEDLEGEWQAFLADLPHLDAVQWTKETKEGLSLAQIAKQVEIHGPDLIVLGTHGRTGIPHMLLGRVAERVVQQISCPVLTIRPDAFEFTLP
jgi:nucleotide-binding universal stress UspA family protein